MWVTLLGGRSYLVRRPAQILTIALLLSGFLLTSVLTGCDPAFDGHLQKKFSPVRVVEDDETKDQFTVAAKVQSLLKAKDFDQLENFFGDVRSSKAAYTDGVWKLVYCYKALSDIADNSPDALWKRRLADLRQWTEQKPDSITARVGLAQTMVGYAAAARGNGFFDTVTEAQWQLFYERLAEARHILLDARKLKATCPAWWSVMLKIAHGEGWDDQTYDKVFHEAIAIEPGYVSFYHRKAFRLLPEWHGKYGDWEKFALNSAKEIGGEEGDILYARIVWEIFNSGTYDQIFKECNLSRDKVKRGYLAMLKCHPDSLALLSQCCRIAGAADDFELQRTMFTKLDGRVDLDVWTKERFERCRRFAYTPGHGAAIPVQARSRTNSNSASSKSITAARLATLRLQGISGTEARKLALINNRTLAAGEFTLFKTSAGDFKVRCDEIREKAVIVTIEGDPDRQKLELKQ
jgi:hypothetical protein